MARSPEGEAGWRFPFVVRCPGPVGRLARFRQAISRTAQDIYYDEQGAETRQDPVVVAGCSVDGEVVAGVPPMSTWFRLSPGSRWPLHAHDCELGVGVLEGNSRSQCAHEKKVHDGTDP